MKKNSFKKMASIMMATVCLCVTFANPVSAATYAWSSGKNMASDITTVYPVSVPLNLGTLYFELEELYSECSYAVAVCQGTNVTINNTNEKVMVTKTDTPVALKVKNVVVMPTTMKFNCFIDNNATRYQIVSGTGILYD